MTVTKKIVRVRTGCITCRKRRIKCDEARPGCDRCRNANFNCEGYESPRSVRNETPTPRKASKAVVKVQCLTPSPSTSPRLDTSSLDMVEELPWRQTNWRSDQLPIYHHFVTSTVTRIFSADHLSFWRDRVAQMSFGVEGVYEALLAVGAAHRASLLCYSKINFQEITRLRVQGLSAYGRALRLLGADMQSQGKGKTDPEAMLIILLLCTYFECFMESSKPALRHLYAAIQVLRRSLPQVSPTDLTANMVPIYDVILRFDFLALKLVPYASSSFSRCSTLALMERPFWSRQPDGFPSSPRQVDGRLFPNSSTITTERHRLIQLVSGHNKFSRVVWGPWYPTSKRPSRDELLGFYSEMLLWKATSPMTFASCVSDLDSLHASTIEEFYLLPMPPQPVRFTSAEAAVNMIMYNGYLGCALAMLCNTDPDPLAREIEAFNAVYQNLRISSGLLYRYEGQGTDEYEYKPCDSLDMGISLYLYHGARRCFSAEWQKWIIAALHSIGQEGLSNAHSLANTLEIMGPLERMLPQNVLSKNCNMVTKSPLGNICDRLLSVVMPTGEEGGYLACFLRYGATEEDSDESSIRIVGQASWRQDDKGNMLGLEVDTSVGGVANPEEQGNVKILKAWKDKVEVGWHGFV